MAKRKKQQQAVRLTRKQVRMSRREQQQRRSIIGATVFVAALVIALVGYGLLDQFVLVQRRPVARVGETEITYAQLDKAVRFRRVQLLNQYGQLLQLSRLGVGQQVQDQLAQIDSQLQTPLVLSRAILDSLIEQELARGEAEKLGIEVSDEELEARLQSFFNYFPDGTPTPFPSPTFVPTQTHTPGPSPTPDPDVEPTEIPTEAPTPLPRPTATEYTAAAYQEAYGEYIGITAADTRMSEDEIRAVFRNAILSERLRDAVITDIPTEEEIVHARHILLGLEDRDLAEEVLTRALDGEDFAALAAEYSIDTSNAESAGDLGSFGRGQMVPAFEEAAFSNDIGIVPELVETQFGFHIVEVLDKGTRPVSDYALNQQRGAAYREWLFELRSNADVEVFTWWEENPPDQPSLDSFIRRQQSTAVAAGTATAHAAPPATETPVPTETATAEE